MVCLNRNNISFYIYIDIIDYKVLVVLMILFYFRALARKENAAEGVGGTVSLSVSSMGDQGANALEHLQYLG